MLAVDDDLFDGVFLEEFILFGEVEGVAVVVAEDGFDDLVFCSAEEVGPEGEDGGCGLSFSPETDEDLLNGVFYECLVAGEFGGVVVQVAVVFIHDRCEGGRIVLLEP